MSVLGISGSLRARLAQHQAAARGRRAGRGAERRVRALRRAQGDPAVRRGRRRRERRRRPSRACARRSPAPTRVLFATPEYNSSIPGVLKNAVDWASRPLATSPLRNKPVAVIGASTGMFGAVWAQAELRKVLGAAGARVDRGRARRGPRPRAPRRGRHPDRPGPSGSPARLGGHPARRGPELAVAA